MEEQCSNSLSTSMERDNLEWKRPNGVLDGVIRNSVVRREQPCHLDSFLMTNVKKSERCYLGTTYIVPEAYRVISMVCHDLVFCSFPG
jgi:hypothetical protein